jgi:hypothetical protein
MSRLAGTPLGGGGLRVPDLPKGPRCPVCGNGSVSHVYVAWGSLGRKGYQSCWTCRECYKRLDGLWASARYARRTAGWLLGLAVAAALLSVGLRVGVEQSGAWIAGLLAAFALLLACVAQRRKARLLDTAASGTSRMLAGGGLQPPWQSQ